MKIYSFSPQGAAVKPFVVQPQKWVFNVRMPSSTRFVAYVSSTRFSSSG